VRSARRIERNQLQPRATQPRGRTAPDPLAGVWEEELVPLLEHLQEQKPDQDWSSLKRTLQRRVQQWTAWHGPASAVMFPLAFQPGEIGFCDFTRVKRVAIPLRGEPFPHLLFHYRLAWSGWAYGQIVHGGESFVALTEGVQNALATRKLVHWLRRSPRPAICIGAPRQAWARSSSNLEFRSEAGPKPIPPAGQPD
jgi:hypothetical protein